MGARGRWSANIVDRWAHRGWLTNLNPSPIAILQKYPRRRYPHGKWDFSSVQRSVYIFSCE
ncbi:hypothetical protein GCM10008927_17430 [Amylibacter ulvae]|uniref:Uncharacterized protein n=1 Tax=Paramylibacter ulvae TaxID=1651968 RepID=A0ABQ3D6F3_9RHOB|nr:hypothetical protein GCM10008927_17430 [Amylibacter ulvae]